MFVPFLLQFYDLLHSPMSSIPIDSFVILPEADNDPLVEAQERVAYTHY